MRLAWIGLCVVCMGVPVGCHPSPPTEPGQASQRPSLAALADRIAPGAPAPRSLVATLPGPIQKEVQARAPKGLSDDAMLDEAKARLSRYSVRLGEPATTLPLVEAFYLAETVALRPGPSQLRAATLLVMMYETVRLSALTLVGVGSSFRAVALDTPAANDPLMPFWDAVQRDGSSLQAAFAAAVLRGSPTDEMAIAVMRSQARSLVNDSRPQPELRLALVEEIVAREGASATADSWLDVAQMRQVIGDVDGARRAIDRSTGLPARATSAADTERAASQLATRRARILEDQARLVTIQSLARSTGVDDRLRRASLLVDNGSLREAQQAYEQLQRDLPHDARPVVGLARLKIYNSVKEGIIESFLSAHDLLRNAADFDHRDGSYYGMRIGLTGIEVTRLMNEAPDPARFKARAVALLASLESLNREYAAFAPDRSAVLGFVLQAVRAETDIGLGTAGLEKRLHEHCTRGVALAARYPDTGDAFRLALGCASLLDVDRAFEVAFRPLPGALRKDGSLVDLQARVLVGLVARHRTFDRLPAVRAAVEAMPVDREGQTTERESLLADLTALSAIAGQASWQDAVDAYQHARTLTPTSDTARVSNNLAIALGATLSSPLNQVVVDHLKRSVSIARTPSDQVARANLAALALLDGSNRDALDLVVPLVKDVSNPPLIARLQTIAAASKVGQDALARDQATAALEALRPDNEAYPGFGSRPFAWALGNFNFSLNTSAADATYLLKLGGYYDSFLMLPTSLRYPDVVALGKR